MNRPRDSSRVSFCLLFLQTFLLSPSSDIGIKWKIKMLKWTDGPFSYSPSDVSIYADKIIKQGAHDTFDCHKEKRKTSRGVAGEKSTSLLWLRSPGIVTWCRDRCEDFPTARCWPTPISSQQSGEEEIKRSRINTKWKRNSKKTWPTVYSVRSYFYGWISSIVTSEQAGGKEGGNKSPRVGLIPSAPEKKKKGQVFCCRYKETFLLLFLFFVKGGNQ